MKFHIAAIGDGASLLVLAGRADAAAVDIVEAALSAEVRDSPGHIVVDLADVPFIGSLGIRMLISLARLVSRRGARICVVRVQPQVREVFETMALFDLIPHAQNEDAALAVVAG